MRRVCLVVGLLVVACTGLAANVWNTKAFTTWSDKELQKVMSDSPWAGKASITHARAGAERGPVPDWKLVVTWRSALPIKQGIIREQFGQNGAVPEELASVLANEEEFYVLGLDGLPAMYAAGPALQGVLKNTSLTRGGGKAPIIPVGARAVMFGPDGQPMEPPQPQAGRGGFGRGGFGPGFGGGPQPTAMLIFFFPKTDAITDADREVEFSTTVGAFNVKRKFRTRDMVANGKLAL